MAGIVTLKCTVIKNGVEDMAMRNPIFVPGPVQPQFGSGRMLTVRLSIFSFLLFPRHD